MPQVETEIWLALKAAIQAAAASLPVAWPGEAFEAPTAGIELLPYVAVGKVTAPPQRVLIGRGDHWRRGSVTLVHVAPVGNPLEWHLQKAAIIAEAFPEDRRMKFGAACLRVTARPLVADPYRDGGYLRTPIIMQWEAAA